MKIKLLKHYNLVRAGSVVDWRPVIAEQLIRRKIAEVVIEKEIKPEKKKGKKKND
jgi:hypothetical protein